MAQQKTKPKNKPIGKKPVEKKHLIDPRYQNTFWTVVIVIILTIFFIVNNTKSVQERGPYPPNYASPNRSIQHAVVDSRISFIIPNKEVNDTTR